MSPGDYIAGDSSEIKEDIEETLSRMHGTLDAINARISFRAATDRVRHFFTTPAGKVLLVLGVGAMAKRKPLLTVAAGSIYLVRKLASKKQERMESTLTHTPSSPGGI